MDEINRRLENATVQVARLLGNRDVFSDETIKLELQKEILDVQKQQLFLLISQLKTIAEIRQGLSGLIRDYHEACGEDTKKNDRKDAGNIGIQCPRWLNGRPIYDN